SKAGTIISAIPAQSVILRTLELPFSDERKIREVIRYELEPHIPYPVEEVIVDFCILERQERGAKVLVAAVSKEVVADHLSLLQEAGIEPEIVDLELFGDLNTYFALYPSEKGEEVVGLVNVGASKTTLKVVQGKRLLLARSISKGGNFITEAIQKKLHLSFAEAEEKKLTEGETAEVFAVIQTALATLAKELEYTFFSYMARAGEERELQAIVLSGGGARTPGISEFFSQHFEVPVHRIGKEERLTALFPQIPPLSSSFTVGLGLALRGLNRSAQGMNLRQEEFSFRKSYEEIKGHLIFAGIVLLLILGLHLGTFYYRLGQKEERYQQIRSQIHAVFRETFPQTRVVDPIQQAKQKIQEGKNKLKAFGGITGAQLSSLEILRELSEKIPPTIKVDVFDLLISTESISMSGKTDSFDSVDNLKKNLETSDYFESVKVTNAKVGLDEDTVEFKLLIILQKS
ncbi:MAG: type IV pilus assembly protein PilM, partial [Nitrospinota bacterium]